MNTHPAKQTTLEEFAMAGLPSDAAAEKHPGKEIDDIIKNIKLNQ